MSTHHKGGIIFQEFFVSKTVDHHVFFFQSLVEMLCGRKKKVRSEFIVKTEIKIKVFQNSWKLRSGRMFVQISPQLQIFTFDKYLCKHWEESDWHDIKLYLLKISCSEQITATTFHFCTVHKYEYCSKSWIYWVI